MRHYEVVFLVHPQQTAEVPKIIKQYKSIIETNKGKVHRLEDWGLRQLAYPINKVTKAHYVLMNIECTSDASKEITNSFHLSDAILRNLILSREQPVLGHSPIMQAMEKAAAEKRNAKLRQQEEKAKSSGDSSADTPSSQSKRKAGTKAKTKNQATKEEIKSTSKEAINPAETKPAKIKKQAMKEATTPSKTKPTEIKDQATEEGITSTENSQPKKKHT